MKIYSNCSNRSDCFDISINIPDDYNHLCCICLETCGSSESANMNCCKIHIHDKCLFRVVLHNLHKCPVCRRDLEVNQLFTEKVIHQYFESFSKPEQLRYYTSRNNLLLRQFRFKCFSIPPRFTRFFLIVLFICLFYVGLFISLTLFNTMLHTQHHLDPNYYHDFEHNHNHYDHYDHYSNHNHYQESPAVSKLIEYNDVME